MKIKGAVKFLAELVFVIVLSMLIVTFVGQRICVDGQSMENTLHHGDNLILDKLSYRFQSPKRYDIIVFPHMDEGKKRFYIKRVIGLPGEEVFIDGDGTVFINGEELKESYGKETIEDAGIAASPILLGGDEYFVMGDNRNSSSDSRDPDVGVVKKKELMGKALFRIYPFNQIGVLE